MPGDRPAVHFRRAVIDAERADLAEQPRDDRIVGDAEPAQDLHAAIDDAPDRLRADDFGHARFVAGALAPVEQPCGVPDDEPARMQIHLIVGKHEPDALVFAQRPAEGMAAAGVIDGDVVRPPRRAEPAHRVRQARRGEPRLGVAETLADPPQHLARRHPHALEPHDGIPPAMYWSSVSSTRSITMPGVLIGTRNSVAPAGPAGSLSVFAMMIARSAPAPGAGSVIMKHERISPAASGLSQRCLCRSSAAASSRCMLASSGAKQLSAIGPSGE